MSKPKLVFFGAGPVAARSLELLAQHFDIEAVVTKAVPAGHRGEFPTLTVAKTLGLTIYTPANKKELSELVATKPFTSNVGVVIDYGIIITQDVIDYFEKGIVNSHFSLLPQWRGADPITFSILSGQDKTGVSLMVITAGLDEGPLLAQSELAIKPTDTASTLTEKLIELSDGMLQVILPEWLAGTIQAGDQQQVTLLADPTPTFSRKLTKQDGQLDWSKPAAQLECEIRAFIGWPKSYTQFGELAVVVTKASVAEMSSHNQTPGTPHYNPESKTVLMTCSTGTLRIHKLKPAGKPEMDAASFANGYKKYLSEK